MQDHRMHGGLVCALAVASAAAVVPGTALAQAFAGSSSTVTAKYSKFNGVAAPRTQDFGSYNDNETNLTGAGVSSSLQHVLGIAPDVAIGNDPFALGPGFGHARGAADLQNGRLRSFSTSAVHFDLLNGNTDQAQVTTVNSNWFGDHFSTASDTGGVFNWGTGNRGTFRMDLSGSLSKLNQSGDSILYSGVTSWTAFLLITTAAGDKVRFDWRQGIGGFDANNPYRSYSTQSVSYTPFDPEGDNSYCIVCTIGSYGLLLSEGGVSDGSQVPQLFADINVGGDFDWYLSLATTATVNGFTDTATADYFNTLDVSYQGPQGSVTTAGVFAAITPVPEPSSALMFGAALALWFGSGRYRTAGRPRPPASPLPSV